MSDDYNESRREFFRTLGRGVLAALCLAGIGALTLKPGETCDRNGLCRGCASLADCSLPQALSARAATVGKVGHGGR